MRPENQGPTSEQVWKVSGQLTIIPKPELRAFLRGFPDPKPPFGVTSAEVAINGPETIS